MAKKDKNLETNISDLKRIAEKTALAVNAASSLRTQIYSSPLQETIEKFHSQMEDMQTTFNNPTLQDALKEFHSPLNTFSSAFDTSGIQSILDNATSPIEKIPFSLEQTPYQETPILPKTQKISSSSDLSDLIREARESMGLNQQKFADLAGVGRRFISELENGKATLEFNKVIQVCHAAGLKLKVIERD